MLDFKQVWKHFGTQDVLRDASFRINPGERVGIVGPNGAGKSTVFALILGEISPDKGTVELPKSLRVGHLRQEFNPHEVEDTLLEYAETGRGDLAEIHLEIVKLEGELHQVHGVERDSLLAQIGRLQTHFESAGGYQIRVRASAALCGLGFTENDLSRPFPSFSGGWQMRAELARVLVADPDLLLLDEPTNYLDIPAIEWLREYLKSFAGTMLLISHDRYLLNSLATVTIEVANAVTTRYKGNYDYYAKERVLRLEHRMAAQKNQDRVREQAQRFIDRFRAKNTKAALVQSKIKMLEKMEEVEIPQQVTSPGRIRLRKPERCGHEVVRMENIGFTYDGENMVLRNVDLSIQRGEKLALVGLNGTGKSTLLRIVAGHIAPCEGTRALGHNVIPGYQSQEFAETMDPDVSVFETLKTMGGGVSSQEIRNLLGGFGFTGDAVEKKVAVLSGGEKIRLAFARLLVNPPNFLILDEPTTHLDIAARESLEDALREFEGTICMVSHDIEFVRHVATGIAAMRPPGIRCYCGGYDYYCTKRLEDAQLQAVNAVEEKPRESERKLQRRERAMAVQERGRRRREITSRIENAEKRIQELESEQAKLISVIENPTANVDYAGTNRRLGEIQAEIHIHMEQWEEAAAQLEQFEAENER